MLFSAFSSEKKIFSEKNYRFCHSGEKSNVHALLTIPEQWCTSTCAWRKEKSEREAKEIIPLKTTEPNERQESNLSGSAWAVTKIVIHRRVLFDRRNPPRSYSVPLPAHYCPGIVATILPSHPPWYNALLPLSWKTFNWFSIALQHLPTTGFKTSLLPLSLSPSLPS